MLILDEMCKSSASERRKAAGRTSMRMNGSFAGAEVVRPQVPGVPDAF
jgi:hypothetical protein